MTRLDRKSEAQANAEAVAARSRPYAIDHARSIQKRQSPPRDLLGWFIAGYRSEMPDAIHRTSGVWRDRVTQHEAGQGLQAVGGSLLGTLPNDELFRRFVEDGPFACEIAEYEGHKDRNPHYLFPMRAALARLGSSKAFMARVLQRIAMLDGDVDGAMISFGIIPAIQHDYLEAALYRLWTKYDQEPPARILPSKPREEAA